MLSIYIKLILSRSLKLRQPLPQGPEACPLPLTHVEYPGCYWKERWYKECKNYFQKFTYRKEFVVWLINLQVFLQRNKSSPIQWVFSQIDQALKWKELRHLTLSHNIIISPNTPMCWGGHLPSLLVSLGLRLAWARPPGALHSGDLGVRVIIIQHHRLWRLRPGFPFLGLLLLVFLIVLLFLLSFCICILWAIFSISLFYVLLFL